MGRMNKQKSQPNAPELQHILLETTSVSHPPHNPYYREQQFQQNISSPPPPYPNLSRNIHQGFPSPTYPRMSSQNTTPTVVVHHQPSYYDHRAAKNNKRVRSLNCSMLVTAILAICLCSLSYHLYGKRDCTYSFVVHQPSHDLAITIADVRDMHLHIVWASIFLSLICLAKSASGDSKSYSCYLLLVGLTTMVITIYATYITYLALYSPCTNRPRELISNAVKTITAGFLGEAPAPDKGVFGESNVLQQAEFDKPGVVIFLCDSFVWLFYLSGFLNALVVCAKN